MKNKPSHVLINWNLIEIIMEDGSVIEIELDKFASFEHVRKLIGTTIERTEEHGVVPRRVVASWAEKYDYDSPRTPVPIGETRDDLKFDLGPGPSEDYLEALHKPGNDPKLVEREYLNLLSHLEQSL